MFNERAGTYKISIIYTVHMYMTALPFLYISQIVIMTDPITE
jgi:hypothetical protein